MLSQNLRMEAAANRLSRVHPRPFSKHHNRHLNPSNKLHNNSPSLQLRLRDRLLKGSNRLSRVLLNQLRMPKEVYQVQYRLQAPQSLVCKRQPQVLSPGQMGRCSLLKAVHLLHRYVYRILGRWGRTQILFRWRSLTNTIRFHSPMRARLYCKLVRRWPQLQVNDLTSRSGFTFPSEVHQLTVVQGSAAAAGSSFLSYVFPELLFICPNSSLWMEFIFISPVACSEP